MNTALHKGRGAIFDLDGTLLDTLDDLAAAGNYVLEKYGFATLPPDGYRYYVGNGMYTMIQRAIGASLLHYPRAAHVGDELVSAMRKEASDYYLQNWRNQTRLYVGIENLLAELSSRQIPFAVCSNKDNAFVKEMAGYYFPGVNFSGLVGQGEGIPLKPDTTGALLLCSKMGLRPEETVFVGDTRVDMQTANAAGFFAVGVSWGFRPREELVESGAKLIVDEPGEILRCFG